MLSASWVLITSLKPSGRRVIGHNVVVGVCIALPVSGLLSLWLIDLDTALAMPLYWFFPTTFIAIWVIIKEHLAGSDKTIWFAVCLLPIMLGSLITVLFALGFQLPINPLTALMQGIVASCFLLTIMNSAYLVSLIRRERDREIIQSRLKTQQTAELEKLVKDRTEELESSNQLLKELAHKDGLTNLPNRRSIDLFVDASFKSDTESLGIAILDLDHFKQINDKYGHDLGDLVLRRVAEVLSPHNQDACVAGRFGGEEFAIIERNAQHHSFQARLQKVHEGINNLKIDEHPELKIKACIGWSMCKNKDHVGHSFRKADQALYKAKEEGRNQIFSELNFVA